MFNVLKMSKFNFFTRDPEGNLIIYNFLKGIPSLTKVMKPNVEKFSKLFLTKTQISPSSCEEYSESIEKMLKAGILVDADADEDILCDAKYYEEIFDKNLVLVILPTGKCNFKCSYCFETEQVFSREPMTIEAQNAILKFVQKQIHNYNKLQVSWFGGEPLLELETIKHLSENFIKICQSRFLPYSAQTTTNGFLLDADTFDMLYKNKVYTYMITLDGFREQHDKLRCTCNGKGTYDVIIKNLLRIRDNKQYKFAHINIRVNITNNLMNTLDEFIDFLSSSFSNDPRFSFTFVPAKNYSSDKCNDIFVDEEKVMLRLLENEVYTSKLNPRRFKRHLIESGPGCISGLKNSYVITPDLKIYKCCAHYDMEDNNIGRIDLSGNLILNEALHEKWYLSNAFLKNISDPCNNCFYKPACPNSRKNCPFQYLNRDPEISFCPLKNEGFITVLTEAVLYAVCKNPYETITL